MHKVLVSSVLALLAVPATAQCFDPNFGTPVGVGPDTMFPIQAIGFAFPLAGATYTDLHISDKGYAFFSNGGVPAPQPFADISPTAAELALESPRVCALWADIQSLAANNSQVFINSSPTRCTVTWDNVRCYSQTCGVFDMQMQLLPTGEVFFFYGPGATNNSTQPTWQVGIVGISPGLASPLPAGSDLSATGVTADNTLFEEWLTPNTFDMGGSGLHLVPTNPGWVFLGPATTCATASSYGRGCIQTDDSFYEAFAMSTCDLANTTLSMFRTGTGYTVVNSVPGTFVPPGAGAVQVAGGVLDGQQLFTLSTAMPVAGGVTTQLNVTTKGQIELAPSNPAGVDFTPTAAELLASTQTTFACWHDYNQSAAGSGAITFEETGGFAYVTWNGVYSYLTTAPNTVQFQFELATGNVTLFIGTLAGVASNDQIVVGYSVAGPTVGVDATDLSAPFGALTVADVFVGPGLALAANGLPSLGNASFSLDTSNVPNLVPLAFLFFGDTQLPGIDLGFIGAPDCRAYTNANLTSATFPVALPAGTGTVPLGIPNNVGLIGITLTTQSVAFTTANALNLVTSNGVLFTIGT